MKPTEEELEEGQGLFWRVECESARLAGFSHGSMRVEEISWAGIEEMIEGDFDDPESKVVISQEWLNVDAIRALDDEVV